MFLSRRRLVLIGIVAAIVGVIVLLPLILTITLPDISKVDITINKIQLGNFSEKNKTATLNVVFNIKNPTSQALTTSKIDYKLFANGKSLGQYTISYADMPVNGRPQLLANTTTQINKIITIPVDNEKFANELRGKNQSLQNINWKMEGNWIIDSALSSASKDFSTSW